VIRERAHIVTKDRAGWSRTHDVVEECNRLSEERDWPASRVWKFVTGRMDELVLETDYVDLTQFQQVQQERHDDGGWQILIKPLIDALVDERSYTELMTTSESDD